MNADVEALRARFERAGVRSPNTFIVGAPKCATTAMAEALARHPSVFMSPTKEPHRFGADLPGLGVRSLMPDADYVELFRGVSDEGVVAEASVWTMRSTLAADELLASTPVPASSSCCVTPSRCSRRCTESSAVPASRTSST